MVRSDHQLSPIQGILIQAKSIKIMHSNHIQEKNAFSRIVFLQGTAPCHHVFRKRKKEKKKKSHSTVCPIISTDQHFFLFA